MEQELEHGLNRDRPVIGITMGDPAGIGPELCLRILTDPEVAACCQPIVFGDETVLGRVAECSGLGPAQTIMTVPDWNSGQRPSSSAVVDCGAIDAKQIEPGRIDAACGRAASTYIHHAIDGALAGKIAAVATAPIHKESFRLAQVPFPGHTEMFSALTKAKRTCMMLASEALVVSFVTGHMGLVDVPGQIDAARVLDVIELTADAIRRLKGTTPRLAVLGLNPHAGEHGLFGRDEEQRLIEPAIQSAHQHGVEVEGPVVPDTAFLPPNRKHYDAFICMYHDQGHIPFKMLAFDTGVNITLGLPIIRVSVDHGTAFGIAWQGKANAQSMIQAVRWAAALAGSKTVLCS